MIEKEIRIEGMSCDHCVMAVKKELSRIEGLQVKDVRIGSALVAYEESHVLPSRIIAAIEAAGYRARL